MDVLYGKSLIINFLNKLLKKRTAIQYICIRIVWSHGQIEGEKEEAALVLTLVGMTISDV